MNYWQVIKNYEKNNEQSWSIYKNDDCYVKDGSFEEICYYMRVALEELVNEGLLEKERAFDIIGDRVVFNDLFDNLCEKY